MKCKIKETGNIEELRFTDTKTGCDMADDIIGDSGATLPDGYIHYNREEEVFEIAQEDFTWWEKYFEVAESDNQEVREWRDSFGQRVDEILFEELGGVVCDYEQHHAAHVRAFERMDKEFNPTITVEQYSITRRDSTRERWDDESRRDVHEFATFEEAFDFYDRIDLREEWLTELSCQGRESFMKNTVFACSLEVNGETGDYYKEYGMADYKKDNETAERYHDNDCEYRGDKFFNFHSALHRLDSLTGFDGGWYTSEYIQRREQSVLDDAMEEIYREGEDAGRFEINPSETLSGNPEFIEFSAVRTYAPEDEYEEDPIYEVTFA